MNTRKKSDILCRVREREQKGGKTFLQFTFVVKDEHLSFLSAPVNRRTLAFLDARRPAGRVGKQKGHATLFPGRQRGICL
jgi:hypothetical protein